MDSKSDNESLVIIEGKSILDKFNSRNQPPFSDLTFHILEVSIRIFIAGTVGFSGLISNVINIVMFYRQGFLSHSSVVNLTALAVSDFISCLFIVWSAILGVFDHFFDTSNWSWSVHLFFIYSAGRPYNAVTQITCWVTAFLAFERAMSVVFPFKAKTLFTPRRSMMVMISIYVLTVITNMPHLMKSSIKWVTNSKTNHTYLSWVRIDNFITPEIEQIFFYACPVTLRTLSVVVVVLCNLIIFWKVYLSQKFREVSASSSMQTQSQNDSGPSTSKNSKDGELGSKSNKAIKTSTSTTKEMRLVRMITLISTVFTLCYIPSVLHVIIYYLIWKWNVDYHWSEDVIVWNAVTCLQVVSASTNIFIYYTMSTRYREEFLLCLGKKRE